MVQVLTREEKTDCEWNWGTGYEIVVVLKRVEKANTKKKGKPKLLWKGTKKNLEESTEGKVHQKEDRWKKRNKLVTMQINY